MTNETIRQVCDKLRQFRDCDGDYVREIEDLADEAEAAHKREIAAKDAKIEKLRKLVKELTDAASENMKSQCYHCDLKYACHEGEDGIVVPCNQVIKLREALKKAREEAKDGE